MDDLISFSFIPWSTSEERKSHVLNEHKLGRSLVTIARRLQVNRKTIERDCDGLGLTTWSLISDADLDTSVQAILSEEHPGAGVTLIESALLRRGHRTQERRILQSLVHV
jgi:hypothetical protein